MSAAPERIWAAPPYDDPEWQSGAGEWDVSDGWAVDGLTEYVRADTVQAQIDAAVQQALREVAFMAENGTLPLIGAQCRDAILTLIRKGDQP
jgi:hypothetical protein